VVNKEPVSVNWQSLFIIIPVIDLWASYRVEKLRLYLLIIIAILITEVTIEGGIFGDAYFDWDYIMTEQEENNLFILQGGFLAVEIVVSVILIRKWSKDWNEKLTTRN